MDVLAACSGGNDSVALMQFLFSHQEDFGVVYNNTGWAAEGWDARMEVIKAWCEQRGIPYFETQSEGMEALVRRKKGWPMPASNMQFCTGALKEEPTIKLLDEIDPDKELTICTGRRRLESQNRSDLPRHQTESPKHGGRDCWNPLYMHDEAMRDDLIYAAGFTPLPHSSQECFPCVCANKTDLAAIPKNSPRIDQIEAIEISMGHTRNSKPRTMFRPYRVGGGVGIRQAVDWGHGQRGYKSAEVPEAYRLEGEGTDEPADFVYDEHGQGLLFARQCDGGYCGN